VTLSLRSRLTWWYSGVLLVTVAVFSLVVLWVHWRLLIRQYDEELRDLSGTAANVIEGELAERSSLALAAADTENTVRLPGFVIKVLDPDGRPMRPGGAPFPVAPSLVVGAPIGVGRTVPGSGGPWRVLVRRGTADGQTYLLVAGGPLANLLDEWRALVEALALGVPLALALAAVGGWWIGRRGLQPLADMSAQAREITVHTSGGRLAAPYPDDELGRLAASFNDVLDRLGTALEQQRQFMADASHELRTPVSVIRTAADVTLSQPSRPGEEYRDALAIVLDQSARLARLVDDMLVLARADAGGYPVVTAELDLHETAADCLAAVQVLADERKVALRAALQPAARARGDESLLRRMLLNLLANAIEHTPPGGTVTLTLASDARAIVLSVTDTGHGVPPAERERIFERFVRLDPARHGGGAGLGLAIARWIAEAHGGTLQLARSGPDGSEFVATLPAAIPPGRGRL
jgi:two-component system OmpR family sensor kinase